LEPYLELAIVGMARDTLIKHKEPIDICEESGPLLSFFGGAAQPVIANYNVVVN
jgi:hypothetical protein